MQDKQFVPGLTQWGAPGYTQSTIVPVQKFDATKRHLQALLAGAATEILQPSNLLPALSAYSQAHSDIDY